jgi:hypothetical protein
MAAQLERLGVGKLGSLSLTSEAIQNLITSILDDSSYTANAEKMMRIMDFEETREQKSAIYWTEYTARFGTLHLANPTHNASTIQVYDLDIKVMVILACAIAAVTLYEVCKFAMICMCSFRFK